MYFFVVKEISNVGEEDRKRWQKQVQVVQVLFYSFRIFSKAALRSPENESVKSVCKRNTAGFHCDALGTLFSTCVPLQELKTKVLEQVQDQLKDVLDRTLTEGLPPYGEKHQGANGTITKKPASRWGGDDLRPHAPRLPLTEQRANACLCRSQRMDDGKVFVARQSVLE